jgi:uncharacterized protein involved in outer membrane biogenesis
MKKKLKLVAKILLWVLAGVVVLLLALPLWIGPVVKGVANAVVPGITGTDFHLGEFGLNPYLGTLHVGDMQLANPTNFSEKNAVDLKSLDVDFAMTSLAFGKKYRVEFVEVNGVFVHIDVPKADNFLQIAENATGGKKEPEAEAQEGEQPKVEPEAPKAEETAKSAEPEQAEEKESKGVQIDRITLKDVTIKYGLPVKIPMDIELTGIGAESEYGASFSEVWDDVFSKVKSSLTAVGGAIGDLGKGAAGAIKDAGGAAADTLKDAGGAAADTLKDAGGAAADALKSAGDGIKNLFK